MSKTFSTDFRRFFGRGLAILLPSIVTLWLLWQAFTFVFNTVAKPINGGIRVVVIEAVELFPEDARPNWYEVTDEQVANRKIERERTGLRGIEDTEITLNIRREQFREFWDSYLLLETTGLFIAIILIYLAGMLLSNFVGRRLYHRVERLIARIPGFKQVYPHVKQVVDMIVGDNKMAFSKVVLVEYPSKDIWTVGFLTGDSMRDIDESAGEQVQSVFIPTSPTPFTGFTINVGKSKIRQMDLTIEEALRFVITAGVLAPGEVVKQGAAATPAVAAASPAPALDPANPAGNGEKPGQGA